MCYKLRELIVHERISYPEDYQFFLGVGQLLDHEESLFLNDGYFESELGNCMALWMANLLNLPIIVITQTESMSIVPITPRETLQCPPIFVTFDHSGEGNYDFLKWCIYLFKNGEPDADLKYSLGKGHNWRLGRLEDLWHRSWFPVWVSTEFQCSHNIQKGVGGGPPGHHYFRKGSQQTPSWRCREGSQKGD